MFVDMMKYYPQNICDLMDKTPKRPNGGARTRAIREEMKRLAKYQADGKLKHRFKQKSKTTNSNKKKRNKKANTKSDDACSLPKYLQDSTTEKEQKNSTNKKSNNKKKNKNKSSKTIIRHNRKRNGAVKRKILRNKPCRMPNHGATCYLNCLTQFVASSDECTAAIVATDSTELQNDFRHEYKEHQKMLKNANKELDKLEMELKNTNAVIDEAITEEEKQEKQTINENIELNRIVKQNCKRELKLLKHKLQHFHLFEQLLEAIKIGNGGQQEQRINDVNNVHDEIEFLQDPEGTNNCLTNGDQNDPVEVFDRFLDFNKIIESDFQGGFRFGLLSKFSCRYKNCNKKHSNRSVCNLARLQGMYKNLRKGEDPSVEYLFMQYLKWERLKDYVCTRCKNTNCVYKRFSIVSLSTYLAIQLPRWTNNGFKDMRRIIINETLKLPLSEENNNDIENTENNNNDENEDKNDDQNNNTKSSNKVSVKYALQAIIFHHANKKAMKRYLNPDKYKRKRVYQSYFEQSSSGHYTCTVKRVFNKQSSMHYCDDSEISLCLRNNWFMFASESDAYFLLYRGES